MSHSHVLTGVLPCAQGRIVSGGGGSGGSDDDDDDDDDDDVRRQARSDAILPTGAIHRFDPRV
jgi:hypothetical protein